MERLFMSMFMIFLVFAKHIACLQDCEVKCSNCNPACNCNKPGAILLGQDFSLISTNPITSYFNGEKDRDFCILSDTNLHINAHFVAPKRNNRNTRKAHFTRIQSLGILYDNHQIFIGTKKTASWNNAIDHLQVLHDGLPARLSIGQVMKWQSITAPGSTITWTRNTNSVVIEVENNFRIKATVVPVDLEMCKYRVVDEDCFVYLDLGFKFYSLSGEESGVLSRSYKYARVNYRPDFAGREEFATSSLFSADCPVSRFSRTRFSN